MSQIQTKPFLCLAQECDDFIVENMDQMLEHVNQKHFNFVKFDHFVQKYEPYIISEQEEERNSIAQKETLIKTFKIFLDTLQLKCVLSHKEIEEILNNWEHNQVDQLRNKQIRIQQIWSDESLIQDWDKNFQLLRCSFEYIQSYLNQLLGSLNNESLTYGEIHQLAQSFSFAEKQNQPPCQNLELEPIEDISLREDLEQQRGCRSCDQIQAALDESILQIEEGRKLIDSLSEQIKTEQIKYDALQRQVDLDAQKMQRLEKMLTPYQFSPTLKHRKYTLLSPTTLRGNEISSNLCLVTPALNLKGGIQKFGFKWTKGTKWVYFGVCHLEAVRLNGWKWDSKLGGGTYLINENGYSYSTWDENVNDKQNSFKFEIDVAIYCFFDAPRKILTFRNESTNQTFQLTVNPNSEQLHPCVLIGCNDVEVELIQPVNIPDY